MENTAEISLKEPIIPTRSGKQTEVKAIPAGACPPDNPPPPTDPVSEYQRNRSPDVLAIIFDKYSPFVASLAWPYRNMQGEYGPVDYDDIVSEGNRGLFNALRRYDPKLGVDFRVFAEKHIRGAMRDYLRKHDLLTRSERKKYNQLHDAEDRLYAKLGRWPTDEEVAAKLGLDQRYVAEVRNLPKQKVSLDEFIETGERAPSRYEKIADPLTLLDDSHASHVEKAVMIEMLPKALATLPEKLRIIVEQNILADPPKTLKEIGKEFGITESGASFLLTRAKKLLQEYFKNNPPLRRAA